MRQPRYKPNGDLNRRTIHALVKPHRQPADDETDHDSTDADDEKLHAGVRQRKRTGQHCRHGETIGDQRRRVVDQAFAFQNRDDAARDVQALGDRRGGDGVGRRNNRAQHKAGGERQLEEIVREQGDYDRGEQDKADRQQRDGAQVRTEITPRGEQRRRV